MFVKIGLKTLVAAAALLCCAQSVRGASIDGGNDHYRVPMYEWPNFLMPGIVGAATGDQHPVTQVLNRPAELIALRRTCLTCIGDGDITNMVVRLHDPQVDLALGIPTWGPVFQSLEPGFECSNINDFPRVMEPIFVGGQTVGASSIWTVGVAGERLDVRVDARVHGTDWIDSAIELTLRVRNAGLRESRVGIRYMLPLRFSAMVPNPNPSGGALDVFSLVLRPPYPPLGAFTQHEAEWFTPTAHMWEAVALDPPSTLIYPPYFTAGIMAPTPALDPPPTPPDLLQLAPANLSMIDPPGAYDSCFNWRIPDPPRAVENIAGQMVVVSYWGLDEASAIVVPPGGEVSATQYLVAYLEYPISASVDGPHEVRPCHADAVAVAVTGEAHLIEPTVGTVYHRWLSSSPNVTFADPTAATTEAIVEGEGVFDIEHVVSVGAYEARAATTITVVRDHVAPVIERLWLTPAVLWPPNHRMVPVTIDAAVADECDPAPALRLVSVESSEPANGQGDGDTEPDIEDAQLGTADLAVQLRAERRGGGPGRTYTLTYEAEDLAGNVGSRTAVVSVPHDMRGVSMPGPRPPRRGPRRP